MKYLLKKRNDYFCEKTIMNSVKTKVFLLIAALFSLYATASAQSFDSQPTPIYVLSTSDEIPQTTLQFNITGTPVNIDNPVTVNIYNITGQVLYSVPSYSSTFSLTVTLPTGVYIFQALQGDSANAVRSVIYQGAPVTITIGL